MSMFGRWMANRYGGRAGLYEAIAGRMEKAGVERIRARLAGDLRGRVIEVGCGTGLNFTHYAAGVEVVAIEPIHEFRDLAAARAAAAAARIEVIEGDAQALAFPDASFDAAFVTLVFCSVPDAGRGLAELRRVVRPGGRVVLFEHVRSERPLVRAVQEALNPMWWRFMDGCNLNRDTAGRIRAAGFQVEETQTFALPGAAGLLFPMVEVVARA